VNGDSLILKYPEEGKTAYIQEGANLKIWTRNGNLKGTLQKFKNDSFNSRNKKWNSKCPGQ